MEWYWWVALGVAVVVGGYIKLKILGKWMEKRKSAEQNIPEEE